MQFDKGEGKASRHRVIKAPSKPDLRLFEGPGRERRAMRDVGCALPWRIPSNMSHKAASFSIGLRSRLGIEKEFHKFHIFSFFGCLNTHAFAQMRMF